MPEENQTNQPMSIRMVGLAAVPTGSAAAFDTCLCWAAQTPVVEGNTPAAEWCVYTADAANGDRFRLIKRGIYRVDLRLQTLGANTIFGGISLDDLAANLALDPEPSINADSRLQVRAFGGYAGAAGARDCIALTAKIYITQALINAGILASNTGIVRGRASNGADAAPVAAGLDLPNCMFEISREADLPGS